MLKASSITFWGNSFGNLYSLTSESMSTPASFILPNISIIAPSALFVPSEYFSIFTITFWLFFAPADFFFGIYISSLIAWLSGMTNPKLLLFIYVPTIVSFACFTISSTFPSLLWLFSFFRSWSVKIFINTSSPSRACFVSFGEINISFSSSPTFTNPKPFSFLLKVPNL